MYRNNKNIFFCFFYNIRRLSTYYVAFLPDVYSTYYVAFLPTYYVVFLPDVAFLFDVRPFVRRQFADV